MLMRQFSHTEILVILYLYMIYTEADKLEYLEHMIVEGTMGK